MTSGHHARVAGIAGGASQYKKPRSFQEQSSLRQSMKRMRKVNPIRGSWPRTMACCLGILLPLNFLVLVSLVVGLVLGTVEMPSEISHNDAFIRHQQMMLEVAAGEAVAEITSTAHSSDNNAIDANAPSLDQLPALCLALFHTNGKNVLMDESALPGLLGTILSNQTLLASYLDGTAPAETTTSASHTTATTSLKLIFEVMQQEQDPMASVAARDTADRTMQDLSHFFTVCGAAGGAVRSQWRLQQQQRGVSEQGLLLSQEYGDDDDETIPTSLSFNYIRCVARSNPITFNFIMMPSEDDCYDALPSTQAELFTQSWKASQQALEQKYLDDPESDLTAEEAHFRSHAEATGGEKCAVNMPSAGTYSTSILL